jgi:hypothetical protein
MSPTQGGCACSYQAPAQVCEGIHRSPRSAARKEHHYKVVAIGQEDDGEGGKVDVGFYRRLLKSGKLSGKRYFETVDEIKSYM